MRMDPVPPGALGRLPLIWEAGRRTIQGGRYRVRHVWGCLLDRGDQDLRSTQAQELKACLRNRGKSKLPMTHTSNVNRQAPTLKRCRIVSPSIVVDDLGFQLAKRRASGI